MGKAIEFALGVLFFFVLIRAYEHVRDSRRG